ncbi:MAG: immunity 22 family protein [Verrucomicrobia bacterium]|nr:immunity 22 family protein [Verrucomicrobiota bacterium]
MLKDYTFFRRAGYVSVWIGLLHSEDELDAYLNCTPQFEHEFGFKLNESDMPESSLTPQPVGVRDLVSAFSWSPSYCEEVCAAAIAMGYEVATTMIVFHNFKYEPAAVNVRPSTKLVYLGAFRFS